MAIPNKWVPLAASWSDNGDGTESLPYCKVGNRVACATNPKKYKCMQCKQYHEDVRPKEKLHYDCRETTKRNKFHTILRRVGIKK